MSNFDRLSREERAQVEAAVHDAYVDNEGGIRSHNEADALFDRYIADAVQAHRKWAGVLLDGWRDDGRRAFLRDRWRELAGRFGYLHKGRTRSRTMRRGTRVRHEDGAQRWVQEALIEWTADQLEAAIKDCAARIDEERANIAMYRALLELLKESGEPTVRLALEAKGVSLEEYLASKDAV